DDPRTTRAGPDRGSGYALYQRDAASGGLRHRQRPKHLFRGSAGDRSAGLRIFRGSGEVFDARGGGGMTSAAEIPVWIALLISACLLAGAGLTLLGSIGLLQM